MQESAFTRFGATKGLGAVRALRSLGVTKNDQISAEAFALSSGWTSASEIVEVVKAGAPTIDRLNSGLMSSVGADFMAALRPRTIVGRLPVRRLPPRLRLLTANTPFKAYWVKEGSAFRASVGGFVADQLDLLRVGAVTVASNDLIRSSEVAAEQVLLDDLLAACAEAVDRAFISAANAGIADERPASITATAPSITSTGATVAALDADLKAAAALLIAQGCSLDSASWVLPTSLALKMSLLRGSGGALAYPELGALGGRLAGLPAITSQGAQDEGASTSNIALVDATLVTYSEGEPHLTTSTNATIDLSEIPGTSPMVPTSMFQAEATALLARLAVNWRARRTCAAVVKGITL